MDDFWGYPYFRKRPYDFDMFFFLTGAKRRECMGCWRLPELLLIVSQWIIPENSLRLAPVSFWCCNKYPLVNIRKTMERSTIL